jgi:hypothetical protein
MKTLLAAATLALIALTTEALAQQRTIYGSDGRVIGHTATDTQGTTTLYGSDGRAVTRETTTRSDTTVYDARTGNVVGKVTKEKR